MYTKEEFKNRFRAYDTDRLIENGLRELTDEAREATRELLEERGVGGDALEYRIDEVRRDLVGRSGVTNHCDYCGTSTALGSVTEGGQKFCSNKCMDESNLLGRSVGLAVDLIYDHAVAMKYGPCPVCRNEGGTVEMRRTYHVLSLIWFHRYSEQFELGCRSCGRKASIGAAAGCLLLGWWSLPGLFSTPYNIGRNLMAMIGKDGNDPPSPQLLFRARLDLARRMPAVLQRENLGKVGLL